MMRGNNLQSDPAIQARSILDEMNHLLFNNLGKASEKFQEIQNLLRENCDDQCVIYWSSVATSNFSSFLIDNFYSDYEDFIKILEDMCHEFPEYSAPVEQLCSAYGNAVWRFTSKQYDEAFIYLKKVDEIYQHHPENDAIAGTTCRTLERFIDQADVTRHNDCIKAYRRLAEIASKYRHEREIQWSQLAAAFNLVERETDPVEAQCYYQDAEKISNDRPVDEEFRSVASELGCRVLLKYDAEKIRSALDILEILECAAETQNQRSEVYWAFAVGTATLIRKSSAKYPDLCASLCSKLRTFAQSHHNDDLIQDLVEVADEAQR